MRVIVVDDEEVVAAGVARLLESAGHDVTYCGSADAARDVLVNGEPVALVLLDVHLGGEDGVGLVGEFRAAPGRPGVLLLTGDQSPGLVRAALAAGAAGVIRKTARPAELLAAVDAAAAGGTVLGPDDLLAVLASPREHGPLSPREREVLLLMDTGLGTAAIAGRLVVSEHTVRGHVQNVLRKLGATTRVAALAEARRKGILSATDRL